MRFFMFVCLFFFLFFFLFCFLYFGWGGQYLINLFFFIFPESLN